MAGVMTMPMIIIEIILMNAMYKDRKINAIIIGLCVVALIVLFGGIRLQTAVTDKQFLKSMIPHHSGAILMCEEANIQDPEIKKLCDEIIKSQRQEIDQMKTKLKELEK